MQSGGGIISVKEVVKVVLLNTRSGIHVRTVRDSLMYHILRLQV